MEGLEGLDFSSPSDANHPPPVYGLVLAADVICQTADVVGLGQIAIRQRVRPHGGQVVIVSGAAQHRYGVDVLPTPLPTENWQWSVEHITLTEKDTKLYEYTMGFVVGMQLVLYRGSRK